MTTKFQKTIAIICLVSLLIASIAIAADEQNDRRRPPRDGRARDQRGPRDAQPGRGARGGYGGGAGGRGMGSPEGIPGRGMGGPGGMMGGGMMGGGMRGMGMMGGGYGGGMMGGGMQGLIPNMILRRLQLTEEQSKKFEAIEKKHTKKKLQLSTQHVTLKNKLEDAVDKADKETIVKIAKEMGKNIGDTALLKVAGKNSLKEILNEDQLKMIEKFNKQMAERREMMRKQMEGRGSRGPGFRGGRAPDKDSEGPGRRPGRPGTGRTRPDQDRDRRPSRGRPR
ncbi:MAG: hypothetical protein FVQ82_08865 [Planctomycetes bacterium]|nr:hypothetical protein [Planctomycetota bacterium]